MTVPSKKNTLSNTNNENNIKLIVNYINDLKSNKIPSYPMPLKGTEHETIIKELNNLVKKNVESSHKSESEINQLKLKKEKAQEAEKEHIQFMLSVAQNILNPLNGILGFVDILVSSPKNLNAETQEKYLDFIRQGEFTLLQNIDYITAYANIMTQTQPGEGFCRTKHLLENIHLDAVNKIIPKNKLENSIRIEKASQYADYLIKVSENSVKLIWSVLIEFAILQFKYAKIRLDISEKNGNIILETNIEADDFIRKEQIKFINTFIDNSCDKTLFKPQIGIPLFIAQKQLNLINGKLNYNLKTSQELNLQIIIPQAIYIENE